MAKKQVKKAPKGTMRRVLSYLRGYRLHLAASILLALGSVALTLWLPVLIGDAIDCIIAPGRVDFTAIREIFFKCAVIIAVTALLQ